MKKRQVIQLEHASSEAHLSTSLHTVGRETELKMHTHFFRISISSPTVYYLINGAHKLTVAHYTTCNMDGE